MINQRNYYRILQVQPDASLEIIKTSYRTLMQKLKLHPDLGGDHWNASLINEAYNTLRNPDKRAEYDKELLKHYNIETLSLGRKVEKSERNTGFQALFSGPPGAAQENQRNYYRVMEVQPDSPIEVIEASYQVLSKREGANIQLLEEAMALLRDPKLRAEYNDLLRHYTHADIKQQQRTKRAKQAQARGRVTPNPSAAQPQQTSSASSQRKGAANAYQTTQASTMPATEEQLNEQAAVNNSKPTANPYQGVITQYCGFCKTPHNYDPRFNREALCMDCRSPLFPLPQEMMSNAGRMFSRISLRGDIKLYMFWPGVPFPGVIQDISPSGLGFITATELHIGQVIKIDGPGFKAIAQVARLDPQTDGSNVVGTRFLTLHFDNQSGNFVHSAV